MLGTLHRHKGVIKSGGVDKSTQAVAILGVVFKPRHGECVYVFAVIR